MRLPLASVGGARSCDSTTCDAPVQTWSTLAPVQSVALNESRTCGEAGEGRMTSEGQIWISLPERSVAPGSVIWTVSGSRIR